MKVRKKGTELKEYSRIIDKSTTIDLQTGEALGTTTIYEYDLVKYVKKALKHQKSELKKVVKKVAGNYERIEDKAQALLTFVQTAIKYDHGKIEGVEKGTGKDFVRSPVRTLIDGLGDCKDTSVLYASLLSVLPLKPAFIYYAGHVNVGVPLDFYVNPVDELPDDMVLEGFLKDNETEFYIAETTPEVATFIGKLMTSQKGKNVERVVPLT
jgi:hypothetical protein